MLIEGKNAVRQALEGESTINKIMIDKNYQSRKDEIISLAYKNKVRVEFLPKIAMDKKSKTGHHQGYMAETVEFEYSSVEEILSVSQEKGTLPFIVLLDGIEDPHNLGSIIRVCECAGVNGLVIGKHRSAQVTDSVMRISEGSANHLKISRVTNINNAIEKIKNQGVWTYALELGGGDIYKSDLRGKLCLVIGGEDTGVNKLTREKCDGVITIPMSGKVNSLNASVALGVGVFEAVRQRKA